MGHVRDSLSQAVPAWLILINISPLILPEYEYKGFGIVYVLEKYKIRCTAKSRDPNPPGSFPAQAICPKQKPPVCHGRLSLLRCEKVLTPLGAFIPIES